MYELRVGWRKATQWSLLTWLNGGRADLAWDYGQARVVRQGKPGVGCRGRWRQLPAGIWVWLDGRDGVAVLTNVTEAEYEAVKRAPLTPPSAD